MTIELIFNAAMLIFFGYCYFYIGATLPKSGANELGAEQWPQLILAMLCVLLAVNLYKIVRDLKNQPAEKKISAQMLKTFFTGKLFIGIVLVFILSLLLKYIGFLPSCLLFLVAYSRLLGEKRLLRSIAFSAIITVILYVLFSIGLSIMLPRGIGVFRTFALTLETIL